LVNDNSNDATIATTPTGAVVDFEIGGTGTVAQPRIPASDAVAYTRTHGSGAPAEPTANHIALPTGFTLFEYTIESVLGAGGFGITYLARDANLQCQVALKEYLPNDLAVRTAGQTVMPRSSNDSQGYQGGLDRFLAETRVLASFRHPNIVRVNRFFEANNTAYMVMDYEHGRSLRDWFKAHGPVDEATLRAMFLPLIDGIEVVHKGGIVHRDIKPGNIYVRDSDGSLVLLDFGAARQSAGAATRSLTSIVTPGYAPFEQYHTRGAQGPWSDLYALGGVLYWLVTGQKPTEAPSRIRDDCLIPAAQAAAGNYSDNFLKAIDWLLAVNENDRPQSVAEFRAVFKGEAPPPEREQSEATVRSAPTPAGTSTGAGGTAGRGTSATPSPATNKPAGQKLAMGAGAAALIAAIVFFAIPKPQQPPAEMDAQNPPPAAEPLPPTQPTPPEAKNAPLKPTKVKLAAKPGDEDKPKAQLPKTTPAAASPVPADVKAAPAPTAKLIFVITPAGKQGDVVINDKKYGTAPPLKEVSLPPGKHKVEISGDVWAGMHYHTVELQANEKKTLQIDLSNRF
jgi:serine/threonine protein kinase